LSLVKLFPLARSVESTPVGSYTGLVSTEFARPQPLRGPGLGGREELLFPFLSVSVKGAKSKKDKDIYIAQAGLTSIVTS
jgi:hypothetical protein